MGKVDHTKVDGEAVFELDKLPADKASTQNFLIKLRAPASEIERKPLNLVAAIDISGSMWGDKIKEAKASLVRLVEHLTDSDTLTVLPFDNVVEHLSPSGFMTPLNKNKLIKEIEKLLPRGATNLSGAYLEGVRLLEDVVGKEGALGRFLLFTDGQPTAGQTNPVKFKEMVNKNRDRIVVSTFGYGHGHAADLLTMIAQQHEGDFYFIETPDACAEAFATEFGGLLTTFGQNIRLTIEALDGFECKLHTELAVENDVFRVGDVYSGETKMITGSVTVPEDKANANSSSPFRCVVSYDNLVSGNSEEIGFSPEVVFTDGEAVANEEVSEQVAMDTVAKAHKLANEEALKGDFTNARRIMDFATADVGAKFADQFNLISDTKLYSTADYASNSAKLHESSREMSKRRRKGQTFSAQATQTLKSFGAKK